MLRFLQRDSKGPWAGNWWHKVPDHNSGPQSPFVLKFGVGLTKGACPDWAWGVGRYGRLGNGKGHLFLTLFFQSFLLFHFLVLAPQFYPRCNVSRRERQRESEAGQTDEMETPTTQAASVSGTGLQIKRSREIFIEGKGGGETSRDQLAREDPLDQSPGSAASREASALSKRVSGT